MNSTPNNSLWDQAFLETLRYHVRLYSKHKNNTKI